jgi:integral membrane protein (TIGR01906 family)
MHASPERARALLSVLVAVATIVVIIGVSVIPFLSPIWVGFEQDRSGAAALTGFSPDQVHAVTDDVLHDLILGPPAFAQTVAGKPVFSDRERAHLVEVRTVFIAFGAIVLLGALTLANARLMSHGAAWCRRAVGTGALVLAGAVVLGGIVVALAFEQAFELFHSLFFASGTYTFDPTTERLVQLFPSQFWEETSLAVGVVILAISGVVAWWGLSSRDSE